MSHDYSAWSEATLQYRVCNAAYHNGWRIAFEDTLTEHTRIGRWLRTYGGKMFPKIVTFLQARKRSAFTLAYHTHDSRNSQAGFPDLVLVHPKTARIIFAELKSAKGYPTLEQRLWLSGLSAVSEVRPGIETYLWNPTHYPDIITTLGGIDPVA